MYSGLSPTQQGRIFDLMQDVIGKHGQGEIWKNDKGLLLIRHPDEANTLIAGKKKGENVRIFHIKAEDKEGMRKIVEIIQAEELQKVFDYLVRLESKEKIVESALLEAMQEEEAPHPDKAQEDLSEEDFVLVGKEDVWEMEIENLGSLALPSEIVRARASSENLAGIGHKGKSK